MGDLTRRLLKMEILEMLENNREENLDQLIGQFRRVLGKPQIKSVVFNALADTLAQETAAAATGNKKEEADVEEVPDDS